MSELGVSWEGVALVVASTLGIYLTVIVYARVSGPRSLASFSTFDFAVIVAIGAIVGRVALAQTTLLAGVIGLTTLFVAQKGLDAVRTRFGPRGLVDSAPLLLVAGGRLQDESLRRVQMVAEDVYEALRRDGVGSLGDVGAMVLERNGHISVVHADRALDEHVLAGVEGWPAPESG